LLFMKWFYFSFFQCKYRYRTRFYSIFYSIDSFDCFYFSHFQEKYLNKNNTYFYYSYNIIFFLLEQFGLIVEHEKMEVFYFSRLHGIFDPSSLDFSQIEGLILHPKELWKYLRFIFNKKLTFHQHIKYYANKALSIVICIKMLGNSMHRLLLYQKYLCYKSCILFIIFYSFPLWYYNKVPLSYLLNVLNKMQ